MNVLLNIVDNGRDARAAVIAIANRPSGLCIHYVRTQTYAMFV